METTLRRLSASDKVLALAAVLSLFAFVAGSWPRADDWTLMELAASAEMGGVPAFVPYLAIWHEAYGTLIYGLAYAVIVALVAVASIFHSGLRRFMRPLLWLVIGVLGLILPTMAWTIYHGAYNEAIPLAGWGFWLWTLCVVVVIGVAVNRIAEARSAREASRQ